MQRLLRVDASVLFGLKLFRKPRVRDGTGLSLVKEHFRHEGLTGYAKSKKPSNDLLCLGASVGIGPRGQRTSGFKASPVEKLNAPSIKSAKVKHFSGKILRMIIWDTVGKNGASWQKAVANFVGL